MLLGVLAISCNALNQQDQLNSVSVTELNDKRDAWESGEVLLLDVRTPDEVADGRIPGSINYDFYDDKFDAQLDKLDRKKPVYVYCRSGNRGGKTVRKLNELGFEQVYNVEGGFNAWEDEGLPID